MQILGVNFGEISAPSQGVRLWDKADGPSFSDFADLINPMQHIPVISNLYRQESGDNIGAVAKIAGATAIGGLLGGAVALANEVVEAVTGEDITSHLMGFVGIENAPKGNMEVIVPKPEEALGARKITTKQWIYG